LKVVFVLICVIFYANDVKHDDAHPQISPVNYEYPVFVLLEMRVYHAFISLSGVLKTHFKSRKLYQWHFDIFGKAVY
jgi:hypothetical protein